MENPAIDEKKNLRAKVLGLRDALNKEDRQNAALAIAGYAPSLDVSAGTIVSGFWPIRSEIDVRPLMTALAQSGAIMCLPVVINPTTIVFREMAVNAPLEKTGFGTMGPGPDARECEPEIMLMPLAAFDAAGNRIGYGAGHYDRAIEKLHKKAMIPRLIGIAFDCQQVENIPAQKHDVRLHEIITESGLRRFPTAL